MAEPINFPKFYYTRVPTRQYDPNLGTSYIIGRRIIIPASDGFTKDTYQPTFSGSLIKFGIHMSSYTDGDFWNLSGSNFIICENIYTKTVPESFVLEIGRYITSGSSLILDFYNTGSNSKTIWIDYYFIN